MHVASPFYFSTIDIKRELLDPSIVSTTSLLTAICDHAPSVKTVILTSSFAAILNSYKPNTVPQHTYTNSYWGPLTMDNAFQNTLNGYWAISASINFILGAFKSQIPDTGVSFFL
ncbi:hypothetical protein EDB81DRAFT_814238 [Dactylonectria macrodidyma]|uniref:3-beta hydroxysteroid dehydrogenase/isomerase domain-containing protein n=1 Tax=Dactylonectria macrodidyma TaxID=307937 RepID=A0A9P9DM33_9HYPO|nr:hypothetical protein EDB81DRAFT_814238 [Dactylonectria macrodidyma]